jgi:hypothetical protein
VVPRYLADLTRSGRDNGRTSRRSLGTANKTTFSSPREYSNIEVRTNSYILKMVLRAVNFQEVGRKEKRIS